MTEQEANQNSRREITKVEGNFIELFPVRFAQFKRRDEALTQTITKPRGTAVIRHNSRYFTAFDMDVMLAAFALACRNNGRCFPATLSDFARIMKITDCGKNFNAVRESLAELAATTATFNDIWFDCANRTYKSETALSFIAYKLVGRKEIAGGKLRSDEIRQPSWVELPKYFYDSIENGYFRYIDAEVYFSLPSGLSRAAFLYLEKRLGVKNHYEENIASAIANIIKRPPKPQDIKNFKRRTIRKLSDVFNFDKKKLKKGMLAVSRRVLFNGVATTAPEKVAEAEKAEAVTTKKTNATTTEAATSSTEKTLVIARTPPIKSGVDEVPPWRDHGRPDVHRDSLAMTNKDSDAASTAEAARAATAEKADAAKTAATTVGAAAGMEAEAGGPAAAETAEVTGASETAEKASAAATAGYFTPRTAAGGSTDLPCNGVATLNRKAPRPFGPPRRKLTSHEEYVLERACIFCNRDDDYFKNVVRKYIFLRGADMVGGALGDTRDARPESTSRYLIHLLKNL